MIQLIQKSDIEKYLKKSIPTKEEIINKFIQDAQNDEFRTLLGDVFYFDLLHNIEDSKYREILESSEFEVCDNKYEHLGLKHILCGFAYGRFLVHGSFHVTSFGFVEKSNNDSTPVSQKQRMTIQHQEEKSAYNNFQLIKLFLDNNTEIYDKWNCFKKLGRKRIRKV